MALASPAFVHEGANQAACTCQGKDLSVPLAWKGVRPGELPKGTLEGCNDWGRTGYGGPCPPIGWHRYFFKLHAPDVVLPVLGTPDKARLERAMKGPVLATHELVGTYAKR